MPSFATDLADYLTDRAGETLRCVVRLTAEEYEIVHSREGLDESSLARRAEEIHTNLTRDAERREAALRAELGEMKVTLVMREKAVILHFPRDDDPGVLVSLEPEAARQLDMFVNECTRML